MKDEGAQQSSQEQHRSHTVEGLQDKPLTASAPPPAAPGENEIRHVAEESPIATTDVYAFANDLHNYLWNNIVHAEQKAGFLFATVTGLLAYMHSQGLTRRWLVSLCYWRSTEILLFIATLGLIAAALCVMLVVIPRTSGSPQGIVYWKAIAATGSAPGFVSRVTALPKDQLGAKLLEHCFELSKICEAKFRFVSMGLWCGSFGLGAAIIYLAFAK